MVQATSNNGKPVWVSLTDDCEDNAGGYYCEVYLDDNCDNPVDNFCVHPFDLEKDDIETYIQNYVKKYNY